MFTPADVTVAIKPLNLHKNNGTNKKLSNDHSLHSGPDLAIYIALLLTCMVTHGFSPTEFVPVL